MRPPIDLRIIALLAGALLPLAGCSDRMGHHDAITFAAGNANEVNKAIQTVDPFPPYAEDTTIKTHGVLPGQTSGNPATLAAPVEGTAADTLSGQ